MCPTRKTQADFGLNTAPTEYAERREIIVRPGVTTPDWTVVTSPTVCDALETIFETCNWSERWAGLEIEEDRVRRAILTTYAQLGHAPSTDDLARETGFAPSQVNRLIAKLSDRDMVVLDHDGGKIIGAYPFVDRKTEHHLQLSGTRLNAMCAIDALGAGAMLGIDAKVKSSCRFCGCKINLETGEKGSTLANFAPEQIVVWTGIQYAQGCAADSLCTTMAFFCSDSHLESWRTKQNVEPKGFRLSLDEGFQLGKAIFMPLLAPASS